MERMTKEEFAERFGDQIKDLSAYIHAVPDFPKPGVTFRDIGPLLRTSWGLRNASYLLSELLKHDQGIRSGEGLMIAGVESRGFIFGSTLAMKMSCGLTLVRKKGKLPGKVVGIDYVTEYSKDNIEAQEHEHSGSVIVLDDVLATGGTAIAAVKLLRKTGAVVTGCVFLIELLALKGRQQLEEHGVHVSSLIQY